MAERLAQAHAINETAVSTMLRTASQAYDYVVLDVPHHLGSITGAAIESCDKLLLVLQLTVPGVENAGRIIDAISAEGIPEERIEIVVNRFRKNVHSCTIEMVEKQLHQKVLTIVPSDYRSVGSTIDTGRPLAKRNPVRIAIREAAIRFAHQDASPKRKTWLAKLGLSS